jgi:hypothetical protein
MTKYILTALALVALIQIAWPAGEVNAQIVWRVSVKFILDANGNRPASGNINTDGEVQAQIDTANAILDAHMRGYRLQLTEIVDLSGVSGWYSTEINSANKSALELAAKGAPSTYAWRTNAINIYINGDDGSAICSFPPGEEIIFVGQGLRLTTFLHEIGHFMDLCHTQGCPCGSCDDDETGTCHTIPGDDGIAETIPDLQCWNQNQIAQWTYGQNYASLTAAQQNKVDEVFFNIMSYHATRFRFSPDQLDRMICASNNVRDHVSNGETYFVGSQPGDEECLEPTFLKATFADAVTAASSGDIICMRGSQYPYTGTVNKSVMLRTSRGSSLLGVTTTKSLAMDEDPIPPPPPFPKPVDPPTAVSETIE